ncbi:Nif3-like dinuclear metal center hexameric protein [Ligilactobacillus salitolerans]|uniref:GTP cyclohydrolase 1 type 2 homolog n=1 Tax=Ligilactobacillus salitolerans TaxID=1808352 RepID=A0A401IU36_9LACO|nr:Nif3-like dinuclear metal center hexameric protein [Ligilactobacillus salitolerans]GBG95025.1 Nif3-like dinuclear metal center hexameric protein [Ligilactobacillus salitolerans]
MTTVKDIVSKFENFAPQQLAEKGDPVGLQLGDLNHPVHKMLVTLDVRPETVQEAIAKQVDFIFAHHPMMFHPIHSFDLSSPQNQMYAELIKHNITVYAAHTNLDNANGGMNDWLAECLGLVDCEPLLGPQAEKIYKLAVFVPETAAKRLRTGLAHAGAGQVGNYSSCSFSQAGTGRFLPEQDAQPYIGTTGRLEEAAEEKVEVIFPARKKAQVLSAMYANHPYEQIVFDLYPIEGMGDSYGMGRVGQLEKPQTLSDFIELCKNALKIPALRVVTDDLEQTVQRVALLGGSGAKFYPDAITKKADVYVTGDVSYHTAHDMLANKLNVIDPGHHFEWVCQPRLQELFTRWAKEEDWQLTVMATELNTDPFMFV